MRFGWVLQPHVGPRVREAPDARDALPYVAFQVISRVPGQTVDRGEDGEPAVRLQVDVYSKTTAEGDRVMQALRDAVKADARALSPGPLYWGFLHVTSLEAEDAGRTVHLAPQDASERGTWQTSMDLLITFLESQP